jgi:hypothetical protein
LVKTSCVDFSLLTTGEQGCCIGAGAFSSATSASGDQSATVEPATVTIIPSAKVYSPSGTGHFAICCHTH